MLFRFTHVWHRHAWLIYLLILNIFLKSLYMQCILKSIDSALLVPHIVTLQPYSKME